MYPPSKIQFFFFSNQSFCLFFRPIPLFSFSLICITCLTNAILYRIHFVFIFFSMPWYYSHIKLFFLVYFPPIFRKLFSFIGTNHESTYTLSDIFFYFFIIFNNTFPCLNTLSHMSAHDYSIVFFISNLVVVNKSQNSIILSSVFLSVLPTD